MKVKGTPESIRQRDLRRYYDERFSRRPFRARKGFYSWIAGKAPPAPGSSVLDIGCGGGYMLRELQGRGCRLHGCDISAEAVRIAQREAPQAKFAVADAGHLPYPDSSFDTLYILGSLEHFPDMEAAVREMHRVLRPRGRAVVMVPNSHYIGDLWRKLTSRRGADHHQIIERLGTLSEWKSLLKSGGLKVREVFTYNKFKKRLHFLPLRFANCFILTCTPSRTQTKPAT